MELLVWKGDAVSCSALWRSYQTQGIRMGFQWKQIIPFLSEHISASESAHDRQGSRGSQQGSSHPCQRGLSPGQGGFPVFPAWLEQELGWQERDGGGADGAHGAGGAAQSAVRTAGTRLAAAANGDGKGWKGKDSTQLVPFGFDLESTGVLATEKERGRRGMTHKNIGVSMKMLLPEDRKEEGPSLQMWRELEEKVPLV